MFRKAITLALFAFLAVVPAAAQRRKTPVKPVAKAPVRTVAAEISDAGWKALAEDLQSENWSKASATAAVHLNALKAENDKKQLAQLRYLRLFALAGVILESNEKGNAAEAERTWLELDRAVASFIGKEIVLPPREFAADCTGKLNYICRVRNTPTALRTTATNKSGDGIHSFDYIRFDMAVEDLKADNSKIFLGGVLEKAEYNDDPAKPWVLRLFFKKGFVFELK